MHPWGLAKPAVVAYVSLAVAACGAVSHKSPRLPRGTVGRNLASATATVKAIDLKTRHVTLQRHDGSLEEFLPSDEEQNLDHVSVGDDVTVTHYQSLRYEVTKPSDSERAPGVLLVDHAGQPKLVKPGEARMQIITVAVTIADIDVTAHTLTVRTPDGELTAFAAREDLSQVAVGDLMNITYTDALAFSVDAPMAK